MCVYIYIYIYREREREIVYLIFQNPKNPWKPLSIP